MRGPGVITLVADWDDLDAAVEVACTRQQLAPIGTTEEEPHRRTYELRSPGDEPAWVFAERQGEALPGTDGRIPPQPITLRARFGRFGDEGREAALVDAVARRMRQLAGVDYAPLSP